MATYVLPTTVYNPPSQVRREARVTLIEDEIQVNVPSFHLPTKLTINSPMGDDVPTPRGTAMTITPASDATSESSSMWSHRSSKSSYDSLYDITDDEGEEVPLKLSASIKKYVDKERNSSRYPSLVIPSPSQWPSIYKPQTSCAVGLSPASRIAPSPSAFSIWHAQKLRVPSTSSTPSLDGSLSSEELALSSCPSTPDSAVRAGVESRWEAPMQLHPEAFETLHQLSPEEAESDTVETILEVPEEATQEMKEIVKDTPVRLDFALLSVDSRNPDSQEPVSALSVPSPGGFFSSLGPTAAQTWAIRTPEPSTSVAEHFYGVPWRVSPGYSTEQTVVVSSPKSNGPVTARRIAFSPIEEAEVAEITDVCQPPDHNENYQQELKQSALEHFERTKLWLDDQLFVLRKGSEEDVTEPNCTPVADPSTPDLGSSPISATASPSKKSVRFAPDTSPNQASDVDSDNDGDEGEDIFYEGIQHVLECYQKPDAWVHRQLRAEAVHVERRNFSPSYMNRLNGLYEISKMNRPAPARPISTMLPDPPVPTDDAILKETIASAERERQALDQISPAAWELQAMAYIRGGKLLHEVVARHVKKTPNCMILDFGGKSTCDWAWQTACEYQNSTVHTLLIDSDAEKPLLKGPSNHHIVDADKAWALPFADNTFDVISARSLHAMLKTDEYDLTLTELNRVLKPNGYFEFDVYDASLVHPGPLGQALSVEFAFNLKTRGYDPQATKSFIPKLNKAGFSDIKRAWVMLPMTDVQVHWRDEGKSTNVADASVADSEVRFFKVPKDIGPDGEVEYYEPPVTGSTAAASPLTGLVGARLWEQWILKLASEMGASSEKSLEQVCRVLEEGGKASSGWTCLMGYARK